MKFRVTSNPSIQLASPIFLPSKAAIKKTAAGKRTPKWIQGSKGRLQHEGSTRQTEHGPTHFPDIFAAFDEDYERKVVASDLSQYTELFDETDDGVFDICPESKQTSAMPYISVQK